MTISHANGALEAFFTLSQKVNASGVDVHPTAYGVVHNTKSCEYQPDILNAMQYTP